MTAALGGLLRRLGGPGLERAPGLLLALIAGVGVRLDSPLQTVRQAPTPCLFLSRKSCCILCVPPTPPPPPPPPEFDPRGGLLK